MRGLFVTGTGTHVGKTVLTAALARALRPRDVVALKPIETGCFPDGPADARALAEACDRPALADLDGLYRAGPPLAPYAATLGGAPAIDLARVLATTRAAIADADVALVEGAGGLLVPLDREHSIADLAAALALPLLIVARDGLGVLSDVLAVVEAADRRALPIAAVILARHGAGDPSRATNHAVLAERLPYPVRTFEADPAPLLELLPV